MCSNSVSIWIYTYSASNLSSLKALYNPDYNFMWYMTIYYKIYNLSYNCIQYVWQYMHVYMYTHTNKTNKSVSKSQYWWNALASTHWSYILHMSYFVQHECPMSSFWVEKKVAIFQKQNEYDFSPVSPLYYLDHSLCSWGSFHGAFLSPERFSHWAHLSFIKA